MARQEMHIDLRLPTNLTGGATQFRSLVMQRVGDLFDWVRIEIEGGYRLYALPRKGVKDIKLPVYILTALMHSRRGGIGNRGRINYVLDSRNRADVDMDHEAKKFTPKVEVSAFQDFTVYIEDDI